MGGFFVNVPQTSGISSFVARRVRPTLEGTLFDRFGFRIMPDFGSGAVVLQDAYTDVRFWPQLKLRGGKFKEPVGLERLQSANNLLFVERALPTNLVPNRDLGFQLFGDLWDGTLSYALGVFNGVTDGGSADTDNNDAKDFAGRVFAQPFLKTEIAPLKGLGIGVSGTYGKQVGSATSPNLPSYKTNGQLTFFRYLNTAASGATPANITIANGEVFRLSPQTYYRWGPFGLLGEYVLSSQRVVNGGSTAKLKNQAWQTATSYVLTGEKASYQGVKPKNPFNPKEGKWGAVELAARYHELRVDHDTFPNFASVTQSAHRARAFGGGINWYLNDNVKLVADYEQTLFNGGATTGNRPTEKVVESRLEVAF